MAAKTTDESDVGILHYVSQILGFRGILKQRYSDFIVNEVDRDGNIVHLTSLDVPPEIQVKVQDEAKALDQSNRTYESEILLFRSLTGESDAELLKALIDQINSNSEGGVPPIVLSPDSDKSHRTEVHKFFRESFRFLVTDTVDGPDALSKCIRVRLNSPGRGNTTGNSKKRKERHGKPFDGRGSSHWPQEVGKFLRFHLYKENKDTQEALRVIGKMLGILPRSFGFAGTKDKRSVSTQRVTVFKQHASKLAALNSRLIGIKVGDFCYVEEGLLLGQLSGNRFTITLRGVIADSEDTIKASANTLGRLGFLNYFGLQRFGSGSVPTHFIGAALLRGEWKAAVSMILDPRDGERDAIQKAREYLKESGDIDGSLRQLPLYMIAERAILQSLKKCPGNYLQALKAIPRTLRMMYVHSYQSYLWNHSTSMRVQKYGVEQVVLGDLIYTKGSECGDICNGDHECAETEFQEESDIPVKVVTAEDLASGDYLICDVVLPLPGWRVIYPNNDVAGIYHELAKKDDLSLTKSSHTVKEFSITSLSGGYRRILQKPTGFEWEFFEYTDGDLPLAETDLDKISKSMPLNTNPIEVPSSENKDNDLAVDCENQLHGFKNDTEISMGDNELEREREVRLPQALIRWGADEKVTDDNTKITQLAVKLGFTLPASSYATMAIRELLKTSTSVAFHKTLN